jgi:ABC-type glutathione transport system ATPase component
MQTLLQVTDLSISYRSASTSVHHVAVSRANFEIAPGEVLGLMGESGCGKTSLALAMLGLLLRDEAGVTGSITFRGENLLAMGEKALQRIRGAGISMVYQEPGIALSPVMRVGMQIAEVAHAHQQWDWKKCRAETHSMLARVGLTPTERIFSAYPHQLSGGQLQRVVLAQALICGPALVIADEPTASLDARSQADFIALLRELKQGLRISLLLISHTPEIQASLADRIIVMKDGEIVEEGSFDRVYWNPVHPYTRTLLRRDRETTRVHSEREHAADGELVWWRERL